MINHEEVEEEQGDQSENVHGPWKISETVRKRKQPPELLEAGNTVKDALATLKTTINKNYPQCQSDDDCDLYGKMLAKKLRQLHEDEKWQLMYEIDDMFIRWRNSLLRIPAYSSPLTTYIPSPSPSPQPTYSYNYNQLNRSQTSTSSYSDSYTTQERPSTSRSTYSEPALEYSSPIIHIPNSNNREIGRKIITNNQVVHPATKQPIDTPEYAIINEVFNSVLGNEDS